MGASRTRYIWKNQHALRQPLRTAFGGAEIAVILGSGLGGYAEALENPRSRLSGHPRLSPTRPGAGHAGRWCAGTLLGKRGDAGTRFHAYHQYGCGRLTAPPIRK